MFKKLGEFITSLVEREVARSKVRADRALERLKRKIEESRLEHEQLEKSLEERRKQNEGENNT